MFEEENYTMNKPNRNDSGRYLTTEQMQKETNLCKDSVRKLAIEADALIKYGRAVRVNSGKFFSYLDREYKCDELV